MTSPALQALVLEQCLPILLTKASDRGVDLGRMCVPAATLVDGAQLHLFHQEFVRRRLLAEAPELVRILHEIGRKPSWHNRLEHKRESVIRGRIDPATWARDRQRPRERPRTFPLLLQERQYDTPENRLAASVLASIKRILADEVFPARSQESTLAHGYYRALGRLSKDHVFAAVRRSSIARGDLAAARYRVARRMTGNDRPYAQLLAWIDNWLTLSSIPHDSSGDSSVDLALPQSDTYWQKVFEIWCLEQTRASLARLGWSTTSDFRLHSARSAEPLAVFRRPGRTVALYYQTQKPLGTGRWISESSGRSLVGIPDVALAEEGKAPLLIDAKWRFRSLGQGTSEEQYKMLGYAENFSYAQPGLSFFGVLIFPSDVTNSQAYARSSPSRLTTLRTNLDLAAFAESYDAAIRSWLGEKAGSQSGEIQRF